MRGGPASEVIYGPTSTPLRAFYLADFALNPPLGVLGGQSGMAAAARVLDAAGKETVTEPVGDSLLAAGQWIRGIESGGGGYGDPLERAPEAVLKDVLEHWVSPEAARDVYGIVLAQDGPAGIFTVDAEASAARREALRGGRGGGPRG